MSRDDDWEQDYGDRRTDRWGEEESYPQERRYRRRHESRSGVVTGVGLATLILGSLVLLAGVCGVAGIFIAVAEEAKRGGRASEGAYLAALLLCLVTLAWGGAAIASGIGLMGRRNWARILALVLGGLGALAGVIFLFLGVAALFSPHP